MTLSISAILGLAGQILFIGSIVSVCCRTASPRLRIAMLVLTGLILLIPIHGLILAAYPRGMWGDLSVTSMSVALLEWCAPKHARVLRHQLLWLLPLGLVLMATALGFGYQYYAWGYTSAFGIVIAASALLCFWRQQKSLAWVLLAASAGWQLQLLESRNAWDYVLDVPLLIWLIVILCMGQLNRYPRRLRFHH